MGPAGGGFFELSLARAGPGCRYRYRIDGGPLVPDPASRLQPADVHGPSQVLDPGAFDWQDHDWRGRPWEETILYELHLGTFSPEGTFAGAQARLDDLARLGVTALELMPVSDFPGRRGWGYDGVLPFSPDSVYGPPEDLKSLIQAAHRLGLSVLLDVVYNHFGPEGNYLHLYAPQFFASPHGTPWGAAIGFAGPQARPVRDFFIHNALYWLEEYRLDGLRLDAVHAIADDSEPHLLSELAEAVQAGPGRDRAIHLVLENDRNDPSWLKRRADGRPLRYVAQWNDDFHHAAHVLATGETDGYYRDYAERPARHLARALAEGFAYQGERSAFRGGEPRGGPSAGLPPTAFVNFIQNHDQVGNRALGERLDRLADPRALAALTAILLLAPAPPLLFMGQEWGADSPFLYFCDFGDDLAQSVTDGRRREFARFARFADPAARLTIPDPMAAETFDRSRLDWAALAGQAGTERWRLHRGLIAIRRAEIVPRLAGVRGAAGVWEPLGERGLLVLWRLGDGSRLTLRANLGDAPLPLPTPPEPTERALHLTPEGAALDLAKGALPPWSVAFHLGPGAP
jgi:malto-oligosyltrehalose trehalohydrolase